MAMLANLGTLLGLALQDLLWLETQGVWGTPLCRCFCRDKRTLDALLWSCHERGSCRTWGIGHPGNLLGRVQRNRCRSGIPLTCCPDLRAVEASWHSWCD